LYTIFYFLPCMSILLNVFMVIIFSHINQVCDFDESESNILTKQIQDAGMDDFIMVGEVPHLLHALETNRHQDIILFTNFSPNYFFTDKGLDVNNFRMNPMPEWRVEQYSFSAALYHRICQEYSIAEIHFITSALKRIVNDTDFSNITAGIPTTVQRKQDWFKSGMDYNVLLKKYILDKIHEEADSTSILVPSHENLLGNFVAKFCQN